MLPFNNNKQKLEEYVLKFYENKPKKDHYDGPVPVSMETTQKSHKAIEDMFAIIQKEFDQSNERSTRKLNYLRNSMMSSIKPFQNQLMECIWASTTPEEGEKCADIFIQKIKKDGFTTAQKIADSI